MRCACAFDSNGYDRYGTLTRNLNIQFFFEIFAALFFLSLRLSGKSHLEKTYNFISILAMSVYLCGMKDYQQQCTLFGSQVHSMLPHRLREVNAQFNIYHTVCGFFFFLSSFYRIHFMLMVQHPLFDSSISCQNTSQIVAYHLVAIFFFFRSRIEKICS